MEEYIYVGNYSKKGCYLMKMQGDKLEYLSSTMDFSNCSYVCHSGEFAFYVEEGRESSHLTCARREEDTLLPVSNRLCHGEGPCFITMDPKRKEVLIADYGKGAIEIFPWDNNGEVKDDGIYLELKGKQPRAHSIAYSKDRTKIFVSDLGEDCLLVFEREETKTKLKYSYLLKKGTGPRHFVMTTKEIIYIVTENSCELYTLRVCEERGIECIQTQAILPKEIKKKQNTTGCAIRLDKTEKHLYVSIRGNNCISVFDVSSILPKWIQTVSCEGENPRDICLNSQEDTLLCANQYSNAITIFQREKETGKLVYQNDFKVEAPSCISIEKRL